MVTPRLTGRAASSRALISCRRRLRAHQLWRGRGWPCADLAEETDVVAACPVFDDDAVDDPPDVDVGPREGSPVASVPASNGMVEAW